MKKKILSFLLLMFTCLSSYADICKDSKGLCYEIVSDTEAYCVSASGMTGSIRIPPKADLYVWDYKYEHKWIYKGTYTITGIAMPTYALWDGGFKGLQSISLPNTIKYIKESAFEDCDKLIEITIPNKVKEIESCAFEGCTSLRRVYFSCNSKLEDIGTAAFCNCTSLSYINFPQTLKRIWYLAFANCINLTSLIFPKNLEHMFDQAFIGCNNIEKIHSYVNDSFDFPVGAFENTVYENAKLYLVNATASAYSCWSSFQHIVYPHHTAQRYFYKISSEGKGSVIVDYYETNMDLGMGASWIMWFDGCTVHNEEYETEIPHMPGTGVPFRFVPDDGYKLKQVLYASEENGELVDVTADLANENDKGYTYRTTDKGSHPTLIATFVKDIVEDDNTIVRGNAIFVKQAGETVAITDGVDVTNGYKIPETIEHNDKTYTVNTIAKEAFKDNEELTKVTIPESIESIGESAFDGCINLNTINCQIKVPITLGNSNKPSSSAEIEGNVALSVFSGVDKKTCILNVPLESVEEYRKADGWKEFENIVGVNFNEREATLAGDYLYYLHNDGTATLVMPENAANLEGEIHILGSIEVDDKTYSVTSIGPDAFEGAYYITKVTIPKSIFSIGDGAFAINGLTEVTFEGNSSLSDIGKYAFSSTALINIELPNSVKNIGERAFYQCQNLVSIAIPNGIKKIEAETFRGCSALQSASIPASVESIMENAFFECEMLASAEIPIGMKYIGIGAFYGCEALTSVIIPEGVTKIDEAAFQGCKNLESVSIPSTIEEGETYLEICDEAFSGCDKLTVITSYIENPKMTHPWAFDNSHKENVTLWVPSGTRAKYEECWGFAHVEEMNGVADIIIFKDAKVKAICVSNWDKNGDKELSKTEAAAVTSLGDVFMGNSEITSFDELQYFTGLTTILDNAFSGCGSLKSIRLPKSLTSIGEYAFEDCTSLETVVSFIETPFELGEGAFCARESYDGGNDWHEFDLHFSLYVPVGTKGLYRAAGWDVDESYGNYRTILSGTPENPGSFTVDGIVYDPIDATTVELIDGKNASGDVTIPSMVANGNVSYQVTEIGAFAFKGNISLTSIVIPNCIKAIRPFAFNGCTGLTTVTSYIETPFRLGAIKGVFLNNENVVYATYLQFTLYVPAGTKSLYEQASWTDASRIVEMGGDAYAVFDSTTGTLTFKCGEKPSGDNVYDAEDTKGNPGWRTQMTKVKKVVFDDSFALARPTSTASWFAFEFGDDSSQFTEVIGLQNLNTSNVTNMRYMFSRCRSLTSLDLSHFDTSNVTDMNSMFFYSGLTSLDVSHFNTSNVTDMFNMFCDCSSLTSLDVSSFDTHNVQNMGGMFSGCKALTHINVDNFDTGNATSMMQMFGWCESLTSLDLRQFNTANVTDMYMMFYVCSNLTSICVSDKWSTENITKGNNMFGSCNKLVGGKGTKYDYNHSDYTYAHIDGGTDNPGYFTSAGKLGDANGDGYVNMTDVNAVKDYIMKGKTESFNFFNADANGDKVVNAADIVKIINIIKSNSSSGGDVVADVEPDFPNDPIEEF